MNEAIEAAIKLLVEKCGKEKDSGDELRLSQAALNLAHTAQVLRQE